MEEPVEIIVDIGKRLVQACSNKDILVKLLKQAAGTLSDMTQSSSLGHILGPLSNALVQRSLIHHKDKDVKLLVASCITEIMRILAPNPPYNDIVLKDIFHLLIGTLADLADTTSPYFARRVRILEIVAALKCCILMLDIGCENLVTEMFNVFFRAIKEVHQKSLFHGMLAIMTQILDEKITLPLLAAILQNLLKDTQGSSFRLAVSLIQNCAEKLEPYAQSVLVSAILDKDAVGSELKSSYHEIIFHIYQCAPQMLRSVIPNLTHELLIDQVDVRMKAVHLLGKLFALPGCQAAREHRALFLEFIRRFSDKSSEVRIAAITCSKACYMSNPIGLESNEILSALEGRLLDFDEKVRIEAVNAVCDLAKVLVCQIPPDTVSQTTERLRDKKVAVRKAALGKLLELYQAYCLCCMDNDFADTMHFEQIPCRILVLCFDKDCVEFRPQNMEITLVERLFPDGLSLEEQSKHWISFFSYFSAPHKRALSTILSQKRRLQSRMTEYLLLRQAGRVSDSDDMSQKMRSLFTKMSVSFADPSKAEECFQKLHQLRDNNIFKALQQLLDTNIPYSSSRAIQVRLLKGIGEQSPHYEFLRTLSAKCMSNIFNADLVKCIFLDISAKAKTGMVQASCMDLLLIVLDSFPSFLRGSEELLVDYLLNTGDKIDAQILQLIANCGHHLSSKVRYIFPYLERACMRGNRLQAKFSVSAIASLGADYLEEHLSSLYEKLVDSLCVDRDFPTSSQSLGCIAQYFPWIYEKREKEITKFITQKLFFGGSASLLDDARGGNSTCSTSCMHKIYGLKMLVRSFLLCQGSHLRPQISDFWKFLLRLLPDGDISEDMMISDSDRAHIRLAAGKAVLKLARQWDMHMPSEIFHMVMRISRDPSSYVRRTLVDKVNKLLKQRNIPTRYACAFPLAATDCFCAARADSIKYFADFIREYGHEAQMRQIYSTRGSAGTMTSYPEYTVVFMVHFLAHDSFVFSNNGHDADAYARACSPLIVMLHQLMNAGGNSNDSQTNDTVSYLLSIFRAIKKAEDACDNSSSMKLHILADLGALFVKTLCSSKSPSLHALRLVLLPSSLYKACSGQKVEANLNLLATESFVKRFADECLCILEPYFSETSGHSKRSKRCIDDNDRYDKVTSYSASGHSVHRGVNKNEKENAHDSNNVLTTTDRVHGTDDCKDMSLTDNSKECSRLFAFGNQYSNSNLSVGKDLASSCGSVGVNPSNQLNGTNDCVKSSNEELTQCTAHPESINFAKGRGDGEAALIGNRIKVWSPMHKCFMLGAVKAFDAKSGMHEVAFDNGDSFCLKLANKSWKIICNHSPVEKEYSQPHKRESHLENVHDGKAAKEKNTAKRTSEKTTLTYRRNVQKKLAGQASASTNRQTMLTQRKLQQS